MNIKMVLKANGKFSYITENIEFETTFPFALRKYRTSVLNLVRFVNRVRTFNLIYYLKDKMQLVSLIK